MGELTTPASKNYSRGPSDIELRDRDQLAVVREPELSTQTGYRKSQRVAKAAFCVMAWLVFTVKAE
jgi:hypothetical protein